MADVADTDPRKFLRVIIKMRTCDECL